jgi:hypothetical protein
MRTEHITQSYIIHIACMIHRALWYSHTVRSQPHLVGELRYEMSSVTRWAPLRDELRYEVSSVTRWAPLRDELRGSESTILIQHRAYMIHTQHTQRTRAPSWSWTNSHEWINEWMKWINGWMDWMNGCFSLEIILVHFICELCGSESTILVLHNVQRAHLSPAQCTKSTS